MEDRPRTLGRVVREGERSRVGSGWWVDVEGETVFGSAWIESILKAGSFPWTFFVMWYLAKEFYG